MKLSPRTGWLTKDEVAAIVKKHLEGNFKCKVKVSAAAGDSAKNTSIWDHENVSNTKVAEFKGFSFELQDEPVAIH